MKKLIKIDEIYKYVDQEIRIRGWIYAQRSSGKIAFLQLRDGSGICQVICEKSQVSEDLFEKVKSIKIETSLMISGFVKQHIQQKDSYEVQLTDCEIIGDSTDYPIGRKSHGVDFLLEKRHLWIRSIKQSAIMRIRSSLEYACRDFLHKEGFYEFHSPLITPSACEGTTTLFEIDYFGTSAYLSQSGQLYSEAGIMALEKVFCFGPCFRAEKSKTRRHLTEFWGVEPEMAWITAEENMLFQEKFIKYILSYIRERHQKDFEILRFLQNMGSVNFAVLFT